MRAASAFFLNMDTCWVVPNLSLIYTVWFWVLTCSDVFFLLYFLVISVLGVWRETNDGFHGLPQKWKVTHSCVRDWKGAGTSQAWTLTLQGRDSLETDTHLVLTSGNALCFSLYAQSVGVAVLVPETSKPMFFLSSVHVTRINIRIENEKYLYLNIFSIFY